MFHLTKTFAMRKADESGAISADIAMLDVIDHDQDVTRKGFFGTQQVSIVSGHDWNGIMLGKGVVTDDDGIKARFSGQINLDDPDAAKLHSKLKFDMEHGEPLIEWSYGFRILEGGAEQGKFEDQDVQFLQGLGDGSPGSEIMEVSPVVKGAGIGTGTTAVKGRKFADHIESVLLSVSDALGRAESIAALRAEDGKELSADAQRQLAEMQEGLVNLTARVGDLLVEPEPEPDSELMAEMDLLQAQYQHVRQTIGDV